MEIPTIFHIQKFSTHDGDGTRTTVFFKGCPLSCRWCHNPESQRYQKELIYYEDRCSGCGACVAACPSGASFFAAKAAPADDSGALAAAPSSAARAHKPAAFSPPGSVRPGEPAISCRGPAGHESLSIEQMTPCGGLPSGGGGPHGEPVTPRQNQFRGIVLSGSPVIPPQEQTRGSALPGKPPIPRLDRAGCSACGTCADVCPMNARELAGREYPLRELIKELLKDRIFYETSGGGVTLSGGEVMVQDMDYVTELCRALRREEVPVAIDTCGFAPYEHFQRILPYTDLFLYDIKLMDPAEHLRLTGAGNRLILENLIRLSEDGAVIDIRVPVIRGVNTGQGFLEEVIAFLLRNHVHVRKISLLPYHDYAKSKYEHLQRSYEEASMQVPPAGLLAEWKEILHRAGFGQVQIGG